MIMKVVATYQIPARSCPDPDKKGKGIALGMTIGSWSGIPAHQKERQARFAGEYLGFEKATIASEEMLLLKVGYPVLNFPPRISEVLVSVFGKLSMDGEIKLMDISFPPEFSRQFPGPRYGIEAVREKLNVFNRPILMSIFKCGFGLSPKEYADAFREQAAGGVDFVKDDEIFFDERERVERVKLCREVIEDVRQKDARQLIYAVNLSGPASRLLETAHQLVREGANALLVNVLAYGWNVLQELAEDPEIKVVLVAHPALAGTVYPAPYHGISSPLLLGSLMRMAGADLVLFPSPYGSVSLPKEDGLAIACRLEQPSIYKRSFPVPSAGIHPGMIPRILEDFGKDVVVNAGGGIHHHPSGTRSGARAFFDAVEGVAAGEDLKEISERSSPLREALAHWS
jgi:2,3-diketo-5-methylthiopentyl-1-phosphate enolase